MTQNTGQKPVKVSLIQQGAQPDDKEKVIADLLRTVDEVAQKERPDFMMPVEFATTQYVCGVQDTKYYEWAEPIPGPTTELFAEKAKKYEMVFLLPMYEKANVEGVLYNSVVVLGPDGKIIEGTMPDGSTIHRYAKMHIPRGFAPDGRQIDETFYFSGGSGFPTFQTPKGKIGILICYDRHYPEGWRMLALQGAEVVFNPACAMLLVPEKGATSKSMYVSELQTMAMQHCVWVCATNRVGIEEVQDVKLDFYGMSAFYHPTGEIVAQASSTEPEVLTQVIDLGLTSRMRTFWSYYRHRRPDQYTLIDKPMI